MRRLLAIGGALVCLAFAGLATAGVVVTGDTNGTFTTGQSYVVSVNDVLGEIHDPNLGYLVGYNCIPGTGPYTNARGQFRVWENGASVNSTGWLPLTVACSGIDWSYSGVVPQTAPTASGWTDVTVSVEVMETMPSSNGNCLQPCLPVTSYNFSQTYPLVAANSPSTSSTASNTGQAATTTSPAPTTSTAPPQTVTVTSPASTVTVTTSATAPPPVVTYIINVPSTITIQQTGNTITITSNDRRSLQTLCWRPASATQSNCASSSHGVWRVKLRKAPGKRVFLLKAHGKVVARKTVTVRVKS